ncbi:hypothetical protein ACI65C_004564 [Semiaphis heraclei]
MPSCFCCSRLRNAKSKSANISFHKFPAKDNIREKWLNFINENGLNSKDITKNSLLCSAHFDLESFIFNQNQNMRILKKTAVPTFIVERVKNPKNIYPELVKAIMPTASNTDVPSTSDNRVLFERTEVKLSSTYELNTEEDMDISLISVSQGPNKNENVHEQILASCNNSAKDEDLTASLPSVDSTSINVENTSDTFSIKKPCSLNSNQESSCDYCNRRHNILKAREYHLKKLAEIKEEESKLPLSCPCGNMENLKSNKQCMILLDECNKNVDTLTPKALARRALFLTIHTYHLLQSYLNTKTKTQQILK